MSFSLFSRVRRATTEVRQQQGEETSGALAAEVRAATGPVALHADELKLVGGSDGGDQTPKGGWIVPTSSTTTTKA